MMQELRFFLKDTQRKHVDFRQTEQSRGLPPPPLEKPLPVGAQCFPLPTPDTWEEVAHRATVVEAIARRESRRSFAPEALSLAELSFLLWATQGVRAKELPWHALRTVPSAGCRHPFETYLAVNRVEGLDPGLYRFLPLSHQLVLLEVRDDLPRSLARGSLGQSFVGAGAVTFVWTALPQRTEWRYGAAAHKVIALDAGHLCQNLYLACEAIGAGTCAIAAYDQELMDTLVGVDGEDEFVIYLAPVGKVWPEN